MYVDMLKNFSSTLKIASYDSDNDEYMTENETEVVNLDTYAKNISKTSPPKSCDALFFYKAEQKWYLIEFKNGILFYECMKCKGCIKCEECPKCKTMEKKYEIKEKIFESLLLLTKELNKTIDFFQKNMTFILVYNKSKNSRKNILNSLNKLGDFVPKRLEGVYLEKIRYLEKGDFHKGFVEKYCV